MKGLADWKTRSIVHPTDRFIALISALVGVAVFGLSVINPLNTNWLKTGDFKSAQLAWNYFRQTSLIQWPITQIPNYGTGWGTLLTPAGGNVLVSLPLKYLRYFLPDNFQFVGIWIIFCLAMQGYFAARIIGLFEDSRIRVAVYSMIFLFSPICIFRIATMSHDKLGAQWLILWAIYLYLKKDVRTRSWALLIFVSLCIEVYLSAMVLAIFSAFIIRITVISAEQIEIRKAAKLLLVCASVALMTLWALGLFSITGGISGTGVYRLSGTSYLNPMYSRSEGVSIVFKRLFVSNRTTATYIDGEGFQFLGTGILIILPFLVVSLFRRVINRARATWLIMIPVASIGALLFMFAISKHVSIGPIEFNYWWPKTIIDLSQIFRATSRFGWVLYYLIYIAAVRYISKISRNDWLVLVVSFSVLSAQLLDQSLYLVHVNKTFSQMSRNSIPIDIRWTAIKNQYSKIRIYPTFDMQIDSQDPGVLGWQENDRWYLPLKVSSEGNLQINFSYVSRPVGSLIDKENAKTISEIADKDLRIGNLYLFSLESEWRKFRRQIGENGDYFQIDGMYAIGFPITK